MKFSEWENFENVNMQCGVSDKYRAKIPYVK